MDSSFKDTPSAFELIVMIVPINSIAA